MEKIEIVLNNKTYPLFVEEDNLLIEDKDIISLANNKLFDFNNFLLSLHNYVQENKTKFNNLYSINICLLALNNNKKIQKELFNELKNKNLDKYIISLLFDEINNHSLTKIENENESLDLLKPYEELFSSFKKMKNDNLIFHYLSEPYYLDASSFLLNLELLKYDLNLPSTFGEEKEEGLLQKILDENSFIKEEENLNKEYYLASLLYNLIKEKPFKDNNEECSLIIILNQMDFYKIGRKEDEEDSFLKSSPSSLTITSSDLMYAIKIIEENINKPKENVISLITPLFCENLKKENEELNLQYEELKEDPSLEKIINYIISFTQNYHGYQGYYDYFKEGDYIKKIHYSGEYKNFKFNGGLSFVKPNTLVFDCEAIARCEESYFKNDFIFNNMRYEEIKKRSLEDIFPPYLNKLKKKISPYFDIRKINIEFNLIWSFKIKD